MQQALHGPEDLFGSTDGQVGEPVVLEQLEGHRHRMAEMAQRGLVDVVVVAIRTPTGVVVAVEVVARQRVEQLRAIDELTHLVDEHSSTLAVGEQDAERLELLDHGFELGHRCAGTHVDAGGDGDRERHDLPEAPGSTREDGQAPHTGPVEVGVEVLPDAGEVALDGLAPRTVAAASVRGARTDARRLFAGPVVVRRRRGTPRPPAHPGSGTRRVP